MADRFSDELRTFVAERKQAGEANNKIAEQVKAMFPGSEITVSAVSKLGVQYERRSDLKKSVMVATTLPKKPDGMCVYVSLVAGKAEVCGCEGYPYCANHRMKTAPIGGARYLSRDLI